MPIQPCDEREGVRHFDRARIPHFVGDVKVAGMDAPLIVIQREWLKVCTKGSVGDGLAETIVVQSYFGIGCGRVRGHGERDFGQRADRRHGKA